MFFFFFQAEDGIRDYKVTGVQTCALPISPGRCDGRRFTNSPDVAVSPASSKTPAGLGPMRSSSGSRDFACSQRRSGGRERPRGGSGEHTSELPSPCNLVCRLLLEKKKKNKTRTTSSSTKSARRV